MADRIVIVEDERITAEDLAEILKGLGYEVSAVVSSGAEAIREVESNPPDLVLMDIRIKGDMDGAETARILRERFDVPVVYLTAHADRDTLERAKHARPMGYIVKPFHESELYASVEIALSKHRHDRQALSREQHITDVIGALTLGIISIDQNENDSDGKPGRRSLTGWSNQEATGAPVRAGLPDDRQEYGRGAGTAARPGATAAVFGRDPRSPAADEERQPEPALEQYRAVAWRGRRARRGGHHVRSGTVRSRRSSIQATQRPTASH